MTLFKSLFGKKNKKVESDKNPFPWIPLTTVEQLEEINKKSSSKLQIIFKHSTSCGISRMVINMFTGGFNLSESSADIYYLDLHQYREVSNETGYKFQVMHQSPQLLVIKDGVVVAHASHGAISEVDLEKYL